MIPRSGAVAGAQRDSAFERSLEIMRRFAAAFALALAVSPTGLAGASEIIDQQNTQSTGVIQGLSGFGQSFIPTLNEIKFATFRFLVASSPSVTAVMDLRVGDGVGGTLLGTSESTSFSNRTISPVRFDFTAPISLTTGSPYTLVVRSINGGVFNALFANNNPYDRGSWYNGSTNFSQVDVVFSEGADVATVPEPGTLVGAGLGIAAAAGAALNRRRKVAVA